MAKGTPQLEWCNVRLGEDHNWWVDEVSDPVHWDVDALSIIDPRQVDHLIEAIEPLREYGFDPDVFERAFIAFRIVKDLGKGRVNLRRTKESLLESDEKLFALPDIIDEENGPYADLLDHLTRLRVKLLNDLFDFEEKLTVDEVEDQIREAQNNDFIEGKSVHLFTELTAILDFMPAGYGDDDDEEAPATGARSKRRAAANEEDEDDLPDIEEEEDERMKNDASLKWDEDDEESDEEGEAKKGEGDDEEDEDDGAEKDFDDEEEADEEDDKPSRSRRGRR
ncbi:hypothetical protein [Oleiharenicola sp. Vm1]|uniref:hypothetical protein n=1 Tax=Oleiharenicola sp. Vm1 TaxID=3398393 RepID=UPI0039F52F8C